MINEIFKLCIYPDSVLRLTAEPVEKITDDLKEYLDDMVEFMYEADGIGLAAPQIGDSRRIAVMDIGDGPIKVINPAIIEKSEETEVEEEGCLSLPEMHVKVRRPAHVSIKYRDENSIEINKQLDGLSARAFQHEVDHLDGILIIDHASTVQRTLLKSKLRKLEKNYK